MPPAETPIALPIPLLPLGFRVGGIHAGLKRNPSRQDLSLFVSERPATAAGVYTTNLVQAAPVAFDRERTPGEGFRGIVVNSGNANACTGDRGAADACEMAAVAAAALGVFERSMLVLSTGIIGEFLPMHTLREGIPTAARSLGREREQVLAAARGMMTTDTRPKLAGESLTVNRREITIAGFAKGAAMVGPRMATMLGVLLTDAALAVDDAQRILAAAADTTFNCVSVDGHTSTNDTVLLLANAAAGGSPLADDELERFGLAVERICSLLAREIADDGEGATHVIRIEVDGCRNREEARRIARTVADSPLVKTAVHGADPNWGRIVSAAGYAGVSFDPLGLRLELNGTRLYASGGPLPFDAAEVSRSIRDHRETLIRLSFAEGAAGICFFSSDLTAEYVHLNADYHT
jgi:glutamate N-acetyltransferase / amino-acid N-acetyltransferase